MLGYLHTPYFFVRGEITKGEVITRKLWLLNNSIISKLKDIQSYYRILLKLFKIIKIKLLIYLNYSKILIKKLIYFSKTLFIIKNN